MHIVVKQNKTQHKQLLTIVIVWIKPPAAMVIIHHGIVLEKKN